MQAKAAEVKRTLLIILKFMVIYGDWWALAAGDYVASTLVEDFNLWRELALCVGCTDASEEPVLGFLDCGGLAFYGFHAVKIEIHFESVFDLLACHTITVVMLSCLL